MHRTILIPLVMLLLIAAPWTTFAQKHDYIWILHTFGNQGDPNLYNSSIINFNNPPANVDSASIPMGFASGSIAIISDSTGHLELYTAGCSIANAQHEIIEGGDTLNYLSNKYDLEEFCDKGWGYPALMGTLVLPVPDKARKYAILHKDYYFDPNNTPLPTYHQHLYCTYVDMNANLGKGKVYKRQVIITDTLSGSDVTAVRHENGKDWWFMTMKAYTNRFYKYLLTSDTILGPFEQAIGDKNLHTYDVCQAVFSPDGRKYAKVNRCNGVMLYDFDRATGTLSNYQNITWGCAGNLDSLKTLGVAFSPNSRYLYISALLYLFQVDLQAPNIMESIIAIDTFDGFQTPSGFYTNFFVMMHGPDCKIYMCTFQPSSFLHVIHRPDEQGLACKFQQHAIALHQNNTRLLPNYPHYRLDSNMPECDSTLSFVSALRRLPQQMVIPYLYPNPAIDNLYLDIDLKTLEKGKFVLYDLVGVPKLEQSIHNTQWSYQITIGHLASGLYLAAIVGSAGEVLWSGKVLVGNRD
jgi:hypothetical protein